MYDVTDRKSFESILENKKLFLKYVHYTNTNEIPFVIVGNSLFIFQKKINHFLKELKLT